jgi:hypothetical protein
MRNTMPLFCCICYMHRVLTQSSMSVWTTNTLRYDSIYCQAQLLSMSQLLNMPAWGAGSLPLLNSDFQTCGSATPVQHCSAWHAIF